MLTTHSRAALLVILALVAAQFLAGCGDYEARPAKQDFVFEPRVIPRVQEPSVPSAAVATSIPDPLLRQGGDPLLADMHPDTPHAFADDHRGGSAGSHHGWYWVNGDISGGTVAVTINGVSLGRYSVHIDKEITRYCHVGLNTLTFTHYPYTNADRYCTAHLSILNGHAPVGTPPSLIYNTNAQAATSAASGAATGSVTFGTGTLPAGDTTTESAVDIRTFLAQ